MNSINGRSYKEDPTIIAWNLINEPRCETWLKPANDDCPARMQVCDLRGGGDVVCGGPAAASGSAVAECAFCGQAWGILRSPIWAL